jgi:hypothetical protein
LIDPRASREAPQISGSWTPLLGSTGKFDEPGEIHGECRQRSRAYASIRLRAQASPRELDRPGYFP